MRHILVVVTVALVATLAFAGCGQKCVESQKGGVTPTQGEGSVDEEKLEQDTTPLELENEETPEGVVNAFFRTFFRGDSDGAFALLTREAQEAQSENFVAQASETIRWRVVEKSRETPQGLVFVWVECEDVADGGELQRDTLTFALRNDANAWRVTGFSVGEVAVDFEGSQIVAQEERVAPSLQGAPSVAREIDPSKRIY